MAAARATKAKIRIAVFMLLVVSCNYNYDSKILTYIPKLNSYLVKVFLEKVELTFR
jgi:hypothetical protein